jgi:type VI protein secretion system component VasF
MRKASWVLLALLGVLTLLISFLSANLGYRGEYQIGGANVTDIAAGREAVLYGLRGVRGTSAAYAGAFAVLYLSIVFGPYRKGEKWAWWAIFAAYALLLTVVAVRVPLLGVSFGVVPALIPASVALVGLLLDVRRVTSAG